MAKYSEELKGVARALYLKRYTPQEIADELNLPNRRIVYYWAEKYCWAELLSHESTEDALNRRIQSLTLREGEIGTGAAGAGQPRVSPGETPCTA